ncbi:ABC transporter permease [bacterium (Candidatus Blackallbacteria) CG17_big_fil_post_rev_8_21_14_2_50_48_46]|uniref:ABC transporter permease n=1 Tax=bacterium (Candidatus Blackallbacteria) CG17_big_fil_post_rev_8_21_14_2_50_48_46 TaxID=2014261 RepID=A0A2M7G488_9BACT|nr:MAG: ABC transporter permease [bacterium (Candidatus Blackallbacteria) CG18_big_fil_WC_8_21_14_2_50_49_26]PIW16702.1 MAG: ABC transporter permease [bacterium (Candidatus Blackallbacteria) CG17_big_fil_post_rev_8_21_14_2_50_48_46]PIW46208.1 MAG: ABC transporter permease [bacterium (Candidatus Blackallbacteria) CG13_big_fil_rev_8_21_14_2_50_49_14]
MLKVDRKTPYFFLLPGFGMMILLVFVPLLMGISFSFQNITQRNAYEKTFRVTELLADGGVAIKTEVQAATVKFVGLENYTKVFASNDFWQVFGQTLIWTFTNVFFHFVLGLGLALILNQQLRLKGMWRALLLIPWAVPSYITAFSWRWLFNGDYGFFNHLLKQVGLNGVSWLSDPFWSMFAVCVTNIWLGVPFMMITLLGGLQGIPDELYEASQIDGATPWQQFWSVTLPMLKPVAMVTVLLGIVWTFNMFNIIYLVTQDNPHTDILATFSFKAFFVRGEYGLACAYAVVILIILSLFSLLYLKVNKDNQVST